MWKINIFIYHYIAYIFFELIYSISIWFVFYFNFDIFISVFPASIKFIIFGTNAIIMNAYNIIPTNDNPVQGNIFNKAVWTNRFLPKLLTLPFIVYSMPVTPISGKSPHMMVANKKFQLDKNPSMKLIMPTMTMLVGKNIHIYRYNTQVIPNSMKKVLT